jgi:hypothetical protein
MAVARRDPLTGPAPITRLGSLLIAPRSVGGRMLGVCRDAFTDISGCISESRRHDARHDLALTQADHLAARGSEIAIVNGCTCRSRYLTIRRQIRAAQAADQREDDCVIRAWTTARRLAGAIGKLFAARRPSGRGAGR